MKHNSLVSTFGRRPSPRRALIRGLVNSLVEHGRIKTTLAKAKELRRHAERAVTLGKKGTLHARRLLASRYPNEKTVVAIMKTWAPQFKTRPGGYTRILRTGRRPGDQSEMAFIEFLDYQSVLGNEGEKKKPAKGKKAAAATDAPKKEKKAKSPAPAKKAKKA